MTNEIRGMFLSPEGTVRRGVVRLEGGLIAEALLGAQPAEDWSGEGVVMPGFIDVHVHGGGGFDVMDATPEALDVIGRTHGARGTTGWLATTVTQTEASIERAIDAVARYMRSERNGRQGARVLGIHLEGPYLNPKRRGAHREECVVRPDRAQFVRWCDRAEGAIRMITLAPEVEGAEEVIEEALRRGIVVSAGHSDATAAEMDRAVSRGVSHVTHLFNAMSPLHHREPGLAGYALGESRLTADLIVDGIHLHPGVVDLAVRNKGTDKLLLITDAMRAACMGDGTYEIGGSRVTVEGGVARIADGTLAGSLLTLDEAFRRLTGIHGIPPQEASRMASANPAALLRDAGRGSVAPGMAADLVRIGADGRPDWTLVGGRCVYRREGAADPFAAGGA